jgi:hypothetical protein
MAQNNTNLFNYPYNNNGERLCLYCANVSNNRIYCQDCLENHNLRCVTCSNIIIKETLEQWYQLKYRIDKNIKTHYCSRECYYVAKREMVSDEKKICNHPDCDVEVIDNPSQSRFCSSLCRRTNYTSRFIKKEDLHFCEHCKKPFDHDKRYRNETNCPRCNEVTRLSLSKEFVLNSPSL